MMDDLSIVSSEADEIETTAIQGLTQALPLNNTIDHVRLPNCRPDSQSAWLGHVSFAHWLVGALNPAVVVELGTHMGVSFAAFCQGAETSKAPTKCYAIDTWEGDPHAGFYDTDVYDNLRLFVQQHFSTRATMVRKLFGNALADFADQSIDLLHIDGLHTYEAVSHDFNTWLPKLSNKGVVLFHDTCVRKGDFGVWRFWAEITQRYPHFQFLHSSGLGVLAVGTQVPQPLLDLCRCETQPAGEVIRTAFEQLSRIAFQKGEAKIYNHAQRARGLTNIALGCATQQSSLYPLEDGQALSAVNGVRTGLFGFSTNAEMGAWWQVDLGVERGFELIVIYNRMDGPCAPRARSLEILVSADNEDWTLLYQHNGTVFGGIDGKPLAVDCEGCHARYVRFQLREMNFLHLDEVEIYAKVTAP